MRGIWVWTLDDNLTIAVMVWGDFVKDDLSNFEPFDGSQRLCLCQICVFVGMVK